MPGTRPTLIRIQAPNHTPCRMAKVAVAAAADTAPATRSVRERAWTCSAASLAIRVTLLTRGPTIAPPWVETRLRVSEPIGQRSKACATGKVAKMIGEMELPRHAGKDFPHPFCRSPQG